MSSYRPLRFLDASARADEIVANYKLGIGTHSQSSEVHVLADAPEIRVQDEVSEVTETALRITADGGAVSFQSGVDFTNDSKGDIKFQSMLGATTHMTIDGTNSRVGIGTTNPTAGKLDIAVADDGTGIHIRGGDFGTNYGESHIRIGGNGLSSDNISHHAMITGGHTTSGSSYLKFSTITDYATDGNNPVERMRIDKDGKVGFGTTSPSTKLHIVDTNPEITLMSAGNSSGETSGMRLYGTFSNYPSDTGERRMADIQAGFRNGSSAGVWGSEFMSFHVGKGLAGNDSGTLTTERMCITGAGYVGIGTTSPLHPFHIHTDTKPQLFIEGDNNSNATLRSGSGPNYRNTYQEIDFGHYAIVNRGDDNYIDFKVTSGEVAPTTRMRINGNGNVGIQTSVPQTTFDVRSNAIIGEYGAAGFYNGYGRLHVRGYTNSPIILEYIGVTTSGIGNFSGGMGLSTQGSVVDFRAGTSYNGDLGVGGSHIARFSTGGDRFQIYQNVNGTSPYFYYNSSNGYGTYSDRRGKKNIQTLNVSESVQYVKNLNPVSFNYHYETSDVTPQAGFIAQEVLEAETNPCQTQCVVSGHETYDPDDVNSPNLGVGMQAMIPMLVQALQNALERIEALENNA